MTPGQPLFARSRGRYAQFCPIALQRFDALMSRGDVDHDPDVADFQRASMYAFCEGCGRIYADHPPHPWEPCLTIPCSGVMVKL